MKNMHYQDMTAKKGEIGFKRKLILQQTKGEVLLQDDLASDEIEEILFSRMNKTLQQMKELSKKGVVFSPYLEIGAERCQRSLIMENDLSAHGSAADISFEALRSCSYYQERFKKPAAPFRICCDVEELPFKSDSIPFIFCYETLHHFLDPLPVIKEISRVLCPGGKFYFAEEPYKRILHLNVYKRGKKTGKLINRMLDWFLADETCHEAEHGIVENINMPLPAWRKIFSVFEKKEVYSTTLKSIHQDIFSRKMSAAGFFSWLLGGELSGLCEKSGKPQKPIQSITEAIICPECRIRQAEISLQRREDAYFCFNCKKSYPIIDGVIFLFVEPKMKELYPDVFLLEEKSQNA